MKIFFIPFKVFILILVISSIVHASEIISVVPDTATQGDNLWVGVTGMDTHFAQGSGTIQVYLSNGGVFDLDAWSVNPISDTYLEANLQIPQTYPAGVYDLTVADYAYPYTMTAENAFTILADSSVILLLVEPDYGKQGDSLWVSISGQNTSFGQGSYTSVFFTQGSSTIYANNVNVHSSTTLDAYFRLPIDAYTGYYDVSVDADLPPVVTLDSGFFIYPDPGEIISVDPDSAYQNQNLWVAITGSNTNFMQGSPIAVLEGNGGRIYAYQFNVTSPTYGEAYFSIPQETPVGIRDVVIEDLMSPYALVLDDGFEILPDTTIKIVSIDPEYSAQGENLWVTITGLNTNFGLGSYTIARLIQGSSTIDAQSVNVIMPNILQAYIEIPSSAPIGFWDVYVNDYYDPQMIRSGAFYLYPDPGDIWIVNPDSASPGDDLWVSITGLGTDFTAGSGTLVTYLHKDQYNIFSSSNTDITPTSLNAFFQIPSWAPIGLWDVSVTYNDIPIPATLVDGFNIYEDMAMITSVVPDSAYRGDNLKVAISGQNTLFGQGSMTVVWFEQGSSTIYAYATAVYSQTYLESWFDIPASSETGDWDVRVKDMETSEEVAATDAFSILYHCGETNGDGILDISDAMWLLNYIFIHGDPPIPLESAEINCDGDINISDVVWLVNYIFIEGPQPCDSDNDGLPDC
jgi:Dockerin type I domain